ncbi:hypothetical protein Pmani_009875, partial [Petrolisthes manimaculis]
VSFRETREDGQVEGLINTRTVPSLQLRSFLLSGLKPNTNYLACVHAITVASPAARPDPPRPLPNLSPDLSSKCMRVRTNEPPPIELQLTNRLAIMIGVSLGIFIFFGAGTVICCRQVCKERREAAKEKLNNSSHHHGGVGNSSSQDYHSSSSYRQFSIHDNDASANPTTQDQQGQTEC